MLLNSKAEDTGRKVSDAPAKKLYGATIRTIAIFLKLGVVLSLPLKFLQFFRQSLAEQKNKTNRDK